MNWRKHTLPDAKFFSCIHGAYWAKTGSDAWGWRYDVWLDRQHVASGTFKFRNKAQERAEKLMQNIWTEQDYLDYYNERAGIYEFDAGLDRDTAERLALTDLDNLKLQHREDKE